MRRVKVLLQVKVNAHWGNTDLLPYRMLCWQVPIPEFTLRMWSAFDTGSCLLAVPILCAARHEVLKATCSSGGSGKFRCTILIRAKQDDDMLALVFMRLLSLQPLWSQWCER